MNKLFVSALVAASVATPASAGVFEQHQNLWTTIQDIGITTHINHPEMCDGDNDGSYYPEIGHMVVCQDLAKGREEAAWTANDLDTMRHEAFHILQDCMDGYEANSTLTPYHSPDQLADFVANSSYTLPQVKALVAHYTDMGADKMTVVMELEAFAAADSLSATQIAGLLNRHCTK